MSRPPWDTTSRQDFKKLRSCALAMLRVMRKIEALELGSEQIDEVELVISDQLLGTVARLRAKAKRREIDAGKPQ